MSDTTPNPEKKNPETDASATDPGHVEPAAIDYDAAATDRVDYYSDAPTPEQPEGSTRTGSHAAVPAAETASAPVATAATAPESNLADDYAAPDAYPGSAPRADPGTTADYTAVYPPAQTEAYTPLQTEAPAAQPVQTPIYVQAPAPPRDRGNRGAGVLIALLATAVYAAIYSLVVFIIAGVNSTTVTDAATKFSEFAIRPVFYVPVIFFFLALALLVAFVNRGGWWAYVLFGFLVAVVVYFSYIGGALLTVPAWNLTPTEALKFLDTQWLNPGAIAAAVIAREVPIWTGAWIARRGRRVTAHNAEARREYERVLAEGPQITRTA